MQYYVHVLTPAGTFAPTMIDDLAYRARGGGGTGCCNPKLQSEIVRTKNVPLPAPKNNADIIVYLVDFETDGTVLTPSLAAAKLKQEFWIVNFGNSDSLVSLDSQVGASINGKTGTWVVLGRWMAVQLRKLSEFSWVGLQGLAPP
jgi:hypothetical protein